MNSEPTAATRDAKVGKAGFAGTRKRGNNDDGEVDDGEMDDGEVPRTAALDAA
ncbi:MAG: hypothetical protein ACKOCX_11445 [Planctomycetota bacterium]